MCACVANMASCCWLCEYSGSKEAVNLTKFFIDNAGSMTPAQMAIVAHEALLQMAPGAPGTKVDEILEHLTSHTLRPSLRVASMLRRLLEVMSHVSKTITVTDEDTGQTVVDSKSVAAYTKLVSEAMSIYKSGDVSKLTFSDTDRLRDLRPDLTREHE